MARCIIVEDEPLSRDVLRKYIREIQGLELVAECKDAMEAARVLSEKRIDVVFLDINMPGLSGISFARSLTSAPLIVFTTAYPEYAVEGFELNAVDYLVKPYSFERFLKAVNRIMDRLGNPDKLTEAERKMLVKADKKLFAITLSSILFVEGQGDYIRIHLEDKTLVVHDTMKGFFSSLPGEDFMRIHKSYTVNLHRIDFVEGNQVRVGQHNLPVSPPNREELIQRFSSL